MKSPKLFAIFAFRYDAQLVPDLLKNIGGFIDDYIAHDDNNNPETWYHEGKIRNHLIEEARKKGADWVLCIDPDERLENGAGKKIRELIETDKKVVYGFPFRELWTPDMYRVDGVWGQKKKYVLFPLREDQEFMNLRVHSQWHPQNEDYELTMTSFNLYHLKNINPENREMRKQLYNSLDPEKKIQPMGYDYLADETGIELEKIPSSRNYSPPYKESYDIKQVGG